MRSTVALLVILSASFVALALASPDPANTPDPYRNEALVWEHLDTSVHMHADGTGDRIVHAVVRLQSDGAVRSFSVVSIPYASAFESGSIDYIRVHKPDGTMIETPPADAVDLPAPVTRTAPLYSDLKEKQIPVRSLAVGDVIEFQLRTTKIKALAPGQFWGSEHFLLNGGVVLSQTFSLEVPSDTYVQVWDPNHPTAAKQHDNVRTYLWSASQLEPTAKANDQAAKNIKDPDEDADGRVLPSIAWTTFHSWEQVGSWYRGLALSRSNPTPAILSRANELTKDAKAPADQVQALYSFVSTHIRYVGIDFGIGAIQPHAAEEVLANQYGDCKDKDTLLEALLRAKGFTPAPALIGVNITPVADLPLPALFNHVITTVDLPNGRIWLDTTPEVESYRVLIPAIRDQQALLIPPTGAAALARTPAEPPFPYYERFLATGSLDKDGLLKSRMDLTLRSDNEPGFRLLVQQAAPAQWDQAMQSVSQALGFSGTVSNSELRQSDPNGPVHLSYDYTRPLFADWENHRILPLFPALEIAYIDRDKEPEHDIDLGAPRTLEAVTRIKLPPGYTPNLPEDVHLKRDYGTFDRTYRVETGELIIERTAVILKKKVPKAAWKDYYAYTKALGAENGENYIALNLSGEVPPEFADLAKVRDLMKQGDWQAAGRALNQLQTKDPKAPYLMAFLGAIAQHDGKMQEAIADFEAELQNHPQDNTSMVLMLAGAYLSQKRGADAQALVRKYLERKDVLLYKLLAEIQAHSGDDAGAVTTLQDAVAIYPDDAPVESLLAQALHRCHRDPEAVSIVIKTSPHNNDPLLLNNDAYLLSNLKMELPLAESNSRRAIALLESSSTNVNLQQVTDREFHLTSLLIATWDTLGWVLFQQGRAAEAEPYLHAAWVNEPRAAEGNHLAQTLEALGKRSEALKVSELALAPNEDRADARDIAELKTITERLRQAGAPPSSRNGVQALQQMRSFHIQNSWGAAGSATFRLAVANDRIDVNTLIHGSPALIPAGAKIDQLKLPGAVPPGSKARLFREGVLYCSAPTGACDFVLIPHQYGGAPSMNLPAQ